MLPYVLTSQMTPEKGIQHINRHKGRLSRQMVLESWIFTHRRWKLDFFIFNYKNNLKVGYRVKLKTWNCETTRGNISKHSRQVPLNTGNKRKQSNVSPSNFSPESPTTNKDQRENKYKHTSSKGIISSM